MENRPEEEGGPVDLSQFDGVPERVELDIVANGLALDLANEAAALKCSVLDVLDEWGIYGDDRDDLIAKVMLLVAENNRYDREKLEKAEAQRETERNNRPPPRR